MKKLRKTFMSIAVSLSCIFAGMATMTTSIFAFPDEGYNVMTEESKVFTTNDEAYQYCLSHSKELASKYNIVIQYQVVYLSDKHFQSTFYAYNWNSSSTPSGSVVIDDIPTISTTVMKSIKVVTDVLNVRNEAGTNKSTVSWSPVTYGSVLDVYGYEKDANGTTWYSVQVNGQPGYVCADYVQDETNYTGVKDTTPDDNEKAFASGKTLLSSETRVFTDNDSAVAYAQNYGNTVSNRNGGKILYYYVSYAGKENFVLHFYY